ncbi:hypothetical protein D9M72_554840 [compost metagenome]
MGDKRKAVSDKLNHRVNCCISSVVRASAPMTTASGLPENGPAPNTSTIWTARVMTSRFQFGSLHWGIDGPGYQLCEASSLSPATANTAESTPSIQRRNLAYRAIMEAVEKTMA